MARLTNDGEPTHGSETDSQVKETETRPPHHFSGVPDGPLSAAGDEPPAVQAHLSENGSHTLEETLSPAAAFSAAA